MLYLCFGRIELFDFNVYAGMITVKYIIDNDEDMKFAKSIVNNYPFSLCDTYAVVNLCYSSFLNWKGKSEQIILDSVSMDISLFEAFCLHLQIQDLIKE